MRLLGHQVQQAWNPSDRGRVVEDNVRYGTPQYPARRFRQGLLFL